MVLGSFPGDSGDKTLPGLSDLHSYIAELFQWLPWCYTKFSVPCTNQPQLIKSLIFY
jgi:hypothetical protein